MSQPFVYPNTVPPKKSNKKWIFIIGGILLIGICCVLAMAGGGYFLLSGGTNSLEGILPQEMNTGGDNGSSEFTAQVKIQEAELKEKGSAAVPFNLSVPPTVKIVEKYAFVASEKDNPSDYSNSYKVYTAAILESSTATFRINLDRTLWGMDSIEGTEIKLESGPDGDYAVIPKNQKGLFVWATRSYSNMPTRLDMTLSIPENTDQQKNVDKLNNTALPNPGFSAVSAEFTATPHSPDGLFDIELKGVYINNTPIINTPMGFFLLYDENGNVIAFANTQWGETKFVEPKSQGIITTSLPYRLVKKPSKVVLYPFFSSSSNIP